MADERPESFLLDLQAQVRRIRERGEPDAIEYAIRHVELRKEAPLRAFALSDEGGAFAEEDAVGLWLRSLTGKEAKSLRAKKPPMDISQVVHKMIFNQDEVALLCGVSKRTVEDAIANGALSSVKGFGGRRITRAQLETFIRSLEIRVGFKRPRGL